MKFNQGSAFSKHLQASPQHLSQAYLILCPQEEDRREFIRAAVSALCAKQPSAEISTYDADKNADLRALLSPSLFSQERIAVISNVEECTKSDFELLLHILAKPLPGIYLVFGASAKKQAEALMEQGKKELIVLDLSAEKPWDRQRRIKEEFFLQLKSQGKAISPEAWQALVESCGYEVTLLKQQIEKILVYIGDASRIELKDVAAHCRKADQELNWRLIEKLVWDEATWECPAELEDPSDLFPWLSSLRSHLRTGLKLAALSKQGLTLEEIARAIPALKPQALNAYSGIAPKRGEAYFSQGLGLLYDLEMHLKSSTMPFPMCWDFFLHQFLSLKRDAT